MKKLFTLLLAVAAGVGTMNAAIVNGTCGDNLTWSLNTKDSTLTITGSGEMSDFGYNNSAPWLDYKSYIVYVSLPEGLNSIGKYAFYKCSGLTYIVIPNNVNSIKEYAFGECSSLNSVEIGNSVTSIKERAFHECGSLTSIIIPNSVTSIEKRVFHDCSSLQSITIPNSITSVGFRPFYGCHNLTSITVGNNLTNLEQWYFEDCAIDTIRFTGSIEQWCTKTWKPSEVSSSRGGNAYSLYIGEELITNLIIPNSVTSIRESAFARCSSLTSVEIPNSVTSIGSSAFSDCNNVTSVTISNSVTSIGSKAFTNCNKLTTVNIPNTITNIDQELFSGCSKLTAISIPGSVTNIGTYAFKNCNLSTITCEAVTPPSVASEPFSSYSAILFVPIESVEAYQNALYWEEFTDIRAIGSAQSINWELSCDSILILTGTGEMKNYSYGETTPWDELKNAIKSVIISEGITSIGNYAFRGCTVMTSVTIPNSVTSIGSSAFRNSSGLTSVTIPNSVTSIGDYAFYGCSGLTSVTIPNSVTSIGSYAFYNCTGLTSITIPNSVTNIGSGAFSNCSGLTSVTIPNSVTSIGVQAFRECSGLTSVTIPNSVISIGGSAFSGCTGLTSVTIPNSVTNIGSGAFSNCTGLTAVHISDLEAWCKLQFPQSYSSPLYYAHNLYLNGELVTDLVIPKGIATLGERCFYGCTHLISVTIPDSVTSIGANYFADCTGLISVTIGSGLTSMAKEVFMNCSALTSITCKAITPPICSGDGSGVFSNVDKSIPLYVQEGSVTVYKAADQWKDFTNILPISNVIIPQYTVSLFANIPSYGSAIGGGSFPQDTTITIAAIPNTGYHFAQWSDGITDNPRTIILTQDTTFEAIFRINRYQVQFVDWDGTILHTDSVDNGASATAPANPTREGYTFTSWDMALDNVTEDLVVTAQYTINRYQVQFVDWDGTILLTDSVDYGASAIAPANLTREGYTFTSWDMALDNVTEDLIVTAQYTINRYQVQFVDWDGTILHTDSVDYGASAIAPANPTREGYTFTGWNKVFDNVTKDLIVTAQYTINRYNISVNCNNIQGTIEGESGEFDYMSTLTYRAIPNEGYIFTQWSDGITDNPRTITLTQDTTLTAEFAEDYILAAGTCGEYLTWTLTRDSILTIEGYGNMTSHPWTRYRLYIKIVSLPDGLTNTCKEAFKYCSNLTSVTIPNSVTTIGEYAFANCSSLISITIPNSVTHIGPRAFEKCISLTSITIPNSVTNIGGYAFQGCSSLTSITLPNSITSIGNNVFSGCDSLMAIYVPCGELDRFVTMLRNDSRVQYTPLPYSITTTAVNGIINVPICYEEPIQITAIPNAGYIFTQWSDGITDNPRTITLTQDTMFTAKFSELSIDGLVYSFDTNKQTAELIRVANKNIASIIIPDTIVYDNSTYAVVTIGQDAFRSCHALTSVTIGENITTIQAGAFSGCNALSSISIPNNVISIGQDAFRNCTSLSSAHIGNNVAEIGISAFDGCTQLSQIVIPTNVTSIGNNAFWGCTGLRTIEWNAEYVNTSSTSLSPFHGIESQITSFIIGDSVKYLPARLCYNFINLSSVIIPNSVRGIGEGAFYNCSSLSSVTIPNSVTSIGSAAFRGCSFSAISIPNSVTSIGEKAFAYCTNLEDVTIGTEVTTLGRSVFSTSASIKRVQWNAINYRQAKPERDSNCFPFYASRDSISSFVFGEGVNYVPEYLLKDFSAIQSLVIPASVTNIDRYAFANDSLTEMTCLAEIPPTIDSTAIVGMNTSTCVLYVPYSSVNTYRNANVWKEFVNIRAIGAEEVEEPEDDIVITPSNTTASIIWALISNAVSYELVIRDMNGNVICTLTFNAYGQLTGIAFAPSRNRQAQQTQVAGFQFVVSGLENGTTYEYEFNAKDENDNIIETFTGTFTTTNDTPTSVENTPENMLNVPKKVIYNNQIFIIRGDKIYTLQGQEVK